MGDEKPLVMIDDDGIHDNMVEFYYKDGIDTGKYVLLGREPDPDRIYTSRIIKVSCVLSRKIYGALEEAFKRKGLI